MKKILGILVLGLLLITPSWADDIRDFEIEGMSVGDSLLDYLTKKEISEEKNSKYSLYYKNNKFVQIGYYKNLKNYDSVSVIFKPNDKNYKIYSLAGKIIFEKNISDCYSKKNEIVSELKDLFGSEVEIDSYERSHSADKTGKSKNNTTTFNFKSNKDGIGVSCYDWSEEITKEKRWFDNLKVIIHSEEFINFLENEQYN